MGTDKGRASQGDSCDIIEREAAWEKSNKDILERIETIEKKVEGLNHINDRIEKLSKTTYDLTRSSGAATEKKLKMDVHYLETVVGCLHQCFHSMETEEKRRQQREVARIEEMETTHTCLHGCMHLHPYLA